MNPIRLILILALGDILCVICGVRLTTSHTRRGGLLLLFLTGSVFVAGVGREGIKFMPVFSTTKTDKM